MKQFNYSLVFALSLLASTPSLPAQADQFGKNHPPKMKNAGLTVVDFAASWCKPCLQSLPKLQELTQQYPKIQFLVISVDETQKGRDKLIQRTKVTLPVVWDQDHSWAEHYDPKGMPSLFIVDQSGKIIYSHVGFNKQKWDHFLDELKKRKLPLPRHQPTLHRDK